MRGRSFARRLLIVAMVLAVLGAGSAANAHSGPRLVVSTRRVMVDAPFRMAVDGVAPHAFVDVHLSIPAYGETLADGHISAAHAM